MNEEIADAIAQHESALLRYAQHFVYDRDTARDIVQDTFLQLCRNPENHAKSNLSAWLFTVCRNRAIDVGRKGKRMQVIEQTQLNACPDPQSDPTMAIESAETVSDVLRHIATLPPNQQEVLRLKFQGGLSYQQIADVTGLSRTNVGFLLHTAIAKLRRELR